VYSWRKESRPRPLAEFANPDITAEEVLRFLWEGYPDAALFETRSDFGHPAQGTLDEALARIGTAHVFGLVARFNKGSKKSDIWPGSTVVWSDVDSFMDADEDGVSLDQAVRLVDEQLALRGLLPSYVQKRNGVWFVFKCSEVIPADTAEEINRALGRICWGDPRAWDIGRLCRIPGREKAGEVPIQAIHRDTSAIYSLDHLRQALGDDLPDPGKTSSRTRPTKRGGDSERNPVDRIFWLPFKRPSWIGVDPLSWTPPIGR
jgi:hypothetical protein